MGCKVEADINIFEGCEACKHYALSTKSSVLKKSALMHS